MMAVCISFLLASLAIGAGVHIPATQPSAGTSPATRPFERTTQCVTRVYESGFDTDASPGPEWSEHKVSRTKKGGRPYLGDFGPNKPVALTLHALPPHKLARISFDLFLLRAWDGSSQGFGITQWDLGLGDGRSLIHTTFNTLPFFDDNDAQAFPDTYPARPHVSCTGAVEKETLGTIQSWGGPDRNWDASAVYHFVLTFPHADDDVTFRFVSKFTQTRDKRKFFGLTNVRVDTLSELEPHTDHEFARLWRDLGSPNPRRFFDAQWALAAAGEPAAAYIADHLGETIDLSDKQIRGVIDDLGKANGDETDLLNTLTIQGRLATGPIDDALADPNATDRVQQFLHAARELITRFPETATELRLQRARQVLDAIHLPDAEWKRLLRDGLEQQAKDPDQLAKLKAMFPTLFTSPPAAGGDAR